MLDLAHQKVNTMGERKHLPSFLIHTVGWFHNTLYCTPLKLSIARHVMRLCSPPIKVRGIPSLLIWLATQLALAHELQVGLEV